jgi:hypothetical protein
MTTPRKRWPAGAEQHRQDALTSTIEARALLSEIRRHLKTNPALAELMLADTATLLADAQRFLETAKQQKE